jgi:hypothetical protein
MDALTRALAENVLSLFRASEGTHRAEGRPLYRMSLAEAGVLLALAAVGTEHEHLRRRFEQHDRLWGQTWLHDPVHEGPSSVWQECKRVYRADGSL